MVGTAIGAVVGIGGAIIGGSSAKKAAKTQANAANTAAQEQLQAAQIASNTALSMYGSTKASLTPYTNTGTAALNQLAMMYGLPVYTEPTAASQTPQIPSIGGSAAPGGGFGSSGGGTPDYAGALSYLPNITSSDMMAKINAFQGTPEQKINFALQLLDHNGVKGDLHGLQAFLSSNMVAPTSATPATPGTQTAPGNGQPGIPNFTAMLDSLTRTPGYQFGLEQGQQALERSAASRGMTLSGAQLKDAQQFGTNYAIQAGWNPYVSQLNSFASLGQNSAAMTGNAGTAAAGQVGSSLEKGATGAGNAQIMGAQALANGQLQQGKMWQDILGGIGSFF